MSCSSKNSGDRTPLDRLKFSSEELLWLLLNHDAPMILRGWEGAIA
ncbi:hypothetical protein [Nostoc sp. 'Lobaria pulmonaria (5183) cyanobiont']|nr:hypothetical protein [Nostoc sp. 'Lobaria pulmonaria (5183) cyanobiont']